MAKVCDICGGQHYAKGKCRIHYVMPSRLNPTPINKVSKNQAITNRAYAKANKAYKATKEDDLCEGKFPGCTYRATETHHSEGRGKYKVLDISTYRRLCHNCHEHVGKHHKEAVNIGLSASRLQ